MDIENVSDVSKPVINPRVQGHSRNNIDSEPNGNSWAEANYTGEPAVEAYFHSLCF